MRAMLYGVGSSERFTPKWLWQRRAYIEGLRDAARIAELQAWSHGNGLGPEQNSRAIVKALYEREITITKGQ